MFLGSLDRDQIMRGSRGVLDDILSSGLDLKLLKSFYISELRTCPHEFDDT